MKQIAIVICNYNYERFIAAAIDSALAQDYPGTRVIVIDDGSTDRSREIIQSYGSRIEPVFKENGGQVSAYNLGVEILDTEFAIFLDSDVPEKWSAYVPLNADRVKALMPLGAHVTEKVPR